MSTICLRKQEKPNFVETVLKSFTIVQENKSNLVLKKSNLVMIVLKVLKDIVLCSHGYCLRNKTFSLGEQTSEVAAGLCFHC